MILMPREFSTLGQISSSTDGNCVPVDPFTLRILTSNRFVRMVNGQLTLTMKGRTAVAYGVLKTCHERAFVSVPDTAFVG